MLAWVPCPFYVQGKGYYGWYLYMFWVKEEAVLQLLEGRVLEDRSTDDHSKHLSNTTSSALGFETKTSGPFRMDPHSPIGSTSGRRLIDSELVRVLAGNMVQSEGGSEEALEQGLFKRCGKGEYPNAITNGKTFLFLGLKGKHGVDYLYSLRHIAVGEGLQKGALAFSTGTQP